MNDEQNENMIYNLQIFADKSEDLGQAFMWLMGAKLLEFCDPMRFYEYMEPFMIPGALQWCIDYEAYVRMCEHGNEPSLSEAGLDEFRAILTGDEFEAVLDYFLADEDDTDEEAKDLIIRLLVIHKKLKG